MPVDKGEKLVRLNLLRPLRNCRLGGIAITVAILVACALARADDAALVAHYTFDEGKGDTIADSSGRGNTGHVHGALFERHAGGYCLSFDGVDDYMDCGADPSLDLHTAATVEAWVYPESRVNGEAGIVGKHFDRYQLTYYGDGKCWWYISSGGNNAKGLLTTGAWHHIAGVFDGTTMTLYIDGLAVDSHASKAAEIKTGGHLFVGCVLSDANAVDPASVRTTYFPGKIDDVRVYSRALPATDVKNQFEQGKQSMAMADFTISAAVNAIQNGAISLRAGASGQIQVDTGKEMFLLQSAFSYPGDRIGWNLLSAARGFSEEQWNPSVENHNDNLQITARGKNYELRRTASFDKLDRIVIADTLTNLGDEPVGLIVRNTVSGKNSFDETFTAGSAENPLIFAKSANNALGLLVEDDISRINFEPNLGLPPNQLRFSVPNFALGKGKSLTLRWIIYVMPREAGYYDVVNRVRSDWNSNFAIQGPFSFFDVGLPLLHDPQALKTYLERRKLGIAALSPWLDYDPGTFDRVWPRDEYKTRMQEAMHLLKAADPAIKVVGSIETDWVAIDPAKIPNGDKLPTYNSGSGLLNAEASKIIESANLPWNDSLKRKADGNLELELYSRGGKPQMSLSVYPRVGNHQFEFLLDQVKFLIDDVGLDGFYIDEFSQGWRGGIPSYEGWDGVSADVDPRTGKILRTFTNCSLVGIDARLALCRYASDRGKVVVANTYATSKEEQALPVNRFSETQASFDPMAIAEGMKPNGVVDVSRGILNSPVGLGIIGHPELNDTSRRLMKAVITYLRHGALYYHYSIEDIPEQGDGSGEYGPINHMFPLTPVALHEGWIEGRERTITAISGEYLWKGKNPPEIHRFDVQGKEVPAQFTVQHENDVYRVNVQIKDWAEIVILE